MSKFKVGDRVRRIKDSHNGRDSEKIMDVGDEAVIIDIDYTSLGLETFGAGHDSDNFELVTPKEKLIETKMELDEIKKFDKSVLAEANEEVLEEISNEQKEVAKTKLRELYCKKKTAETEAEKASSDLKEITKDLKDLTAKK